jgi:hypothetical protein
MDRHNTIDNAVATTVMYSPATLPLALRQLRSNGTPVTWIAESFGVSHVSALRWLSGVNRPSPMACKLAQYVLSQAGYVGAGLPSIGGQTAGNRRGVVPDATVRGRKARRG